MERGEWLLRDPAQITLLVCLMDWVERVEEAMSSNSLKPALEKQKTMLLSR